jgi:hypothetical protein
MITENKLLAGALALAMVGAYVSWHHEPEAPGSTIVQLLDHSPDAVEGIELTGPTATVAVSFFEAGGDRRAWIEVTRRSETQGFVANEAFDEQLERYAKLEAARSLGKLDEETRAEMKLDAPERTLSITAEGETHRFELGGRTTGARDFYTRRPGEAEVVLLRGRVVNDLESPEGRYMQRRVRAARPKEIARLRLLAGGRTLEALHKNRLSPGDAYWARADAPDTVDEALGNYIQKIDRLSALSFLPDSEAFDAATPVLEVTWLDEDGEVLDTLDLRKTSGPKPEWLALTETLGRPARVSSRAAEQLEADLGVVFGD